MLGAVADLTWRRPRLVLAIVAALAVAAGLVGRDVEQHLQAAGFTDSASESERATVLLREALGHDAAPGIVLLVRAPDGERLELADPAVRREIARLGRELARVEHVGRVKGPLGRDPGSRALVARDGRSALVTAFLATQDVEEEGGEAAERAREQITSERLQLGWTGFAPGFNDVEEQTREDLTKAELIAFPVLALLLLFVFRGVVAAGIPLLIGVLSIIGTFAVLRLMAAFVDTSLFALNITTALSLGLAVDYGLLLISRFREELGRGVAVAEAHRRTLLRAGHTVLFSGATVAAAMAALIVLPQRFLYSVGAAGAAVGLLTAVLALLVVGSLLAILGPRIDALSVRRGPAVSDASGGWYRLARGVMRRPLVIALASGGILLALAVPLLGVTLTGPSAEAVPPGLASHEANDVVERSYGRALTEAVTVTVRGDVAPAELDRLARDVGQIDGLAPGTPFRAAADGLAYATFAPEQPALAGVSQDAVDEIRARGVPGATVLVSGNTARFMDLKQSLVDHLPLVGSIVAAVTLVLLFVLTGSVLLPVKTLVMNLLTLAATLGIVVLAFEEQLLTGLLDYPGPYAVEVVSLVFLFAVIFGLATDYAVLVMGRIRELHDEGLPNEEAVAVGIGRTGRVISAAAVMIAAVFLAFAVSEVFFMKQLAIGQAVGVLIDATIVRALLVPSLMRLFGEANWWAPGPMRRWHARYGLQEG
ncbi:MAG TPA: MMPL family transporter [Baekduia sp.]|nr:MMPL family transporter [Baekduia sp.]